MARSEHSRGWRFGFAGTTQPAAAAINFIALHYCRERTPADGAWQIVRNCTQAMASCLAHPCCSSGEGQQAAEAKRTPADLTPSVHPWTPAVNQCLAAALPQAPEGHRPQAALPQPSLVQLLGLCSPGPLLHPKGGGGAGDLWGGRLQLAHGCRHASGICVVLICLGAVESR